MSRSRRNLAMFGLGIAAAAGLAVVAVAVYRDKLYVALPDYPPVAKVHWLDQGWDDDTREAFHHADQGTQTLGIPYEWFVALEQPRIALVGDVGRLNDPAYLDRFGFIPGATIGGETPPPIGFAKSREPNMLQWDGKPWIEPQTGAPLHAIGFTCAACHTGRLTYGGEAVIVDGGPALTDLEKFRQAIGISILFTDWIPGRFDRFARNVMGEGASEEAKRLLREQVHDLWSKRLDVVRKLDKGVAGESVKEGFGRLDALNRIGNQVFGLDLGAAGADHGNYRGWSAPVSYPHLWTTPHFDWVQYNASIMQPMVRNAGQALGVGAPLRIGRAGDDLYESGVQVQNMFAIEQWLSGEFAYPRPEDAPPWPRPGDGLVVHHPLADRAFRGLRAPSWPTHVLGAVDVGLARQGFGIYATHCQECHRPPIGSADFWKPEYWSDAGGGRSVLRLVVKTADEMGTDAAQARRMKDRKVWVPDHVDFTGKIPGPVQAFADALGGIVERATKYWYDHHEPVDRELMDGHRDNRLQAEIAYKARPLDGVWATGPFLHNGSVPNVYALLSPPERRPERFQVGRRDYDPECMGYRLNAVPRRPGAVGDKADPETACLNPGAGRDDDELEGLFEFRTADGLPKPEPERTGGAGDVEGNANGGHAFIAPEGSDRGGWPSGTIGYALDPHERRAVVEFLKTDCVNGPSSTKAPPGPEGARAVRPPVQDTSCAALSDRPGDPKAP